MPAPLRAASKGPLAAGPVAQWLEPAAHNGLVAGSSPAGPTNEINCLVKDYLAAAGSPHQKPHQIRAPFVRDRAYASRFSRLHPTNSQGDGGRRCSAEPQVTFRGSR